MQLLYTLTVEDLEGSMVFNVVQAIQVCSLEDYEGAGSRDM